MRTFVVGDIQGCFRCLEKLLEEVGFSPSRDRLLAVGDLVNRGPQSLETLRFCHSLGNAFHTVLGNHDLHLLAVARGGRAPNHKDTLSSILNAPDRERLLDWLQSQSLMLQQGEYTLVHAGIPPQWNVDEAAARAREVEHALGSPANSQRFFQGMYGNTPHTWDDGLEGVDRLRCITNYFTRMRYCNAHGRLELSNKMPPEHGPPGYRPWFAVEGRKTAGDKILFGHWASLQGRVGDSNAIALDTGCVWGGSLRMIRLDTGRFYHHLCQPEIQKKRPV